MSKEQRKEFLRHTYKKWLADKYGLSEETADTELMGGKGGVDIESNTE